MWPDPISHRGIIAFNTSVPCKKGLVQFTGQVVLAPTKKRVGDDWRHAISVLCVDTLTAMMPYVVAMAVSVSTRGTEIVCCQLSPTHFWVGDRTS